MAERTDRKKVSDACDVVLRRGGAQGKIKPGEGLAGGDGADPLPEIEDLLWPANVRVPGGWTTDD